MEENEDCLGEEEVVLMMMMMMMMSEMVVKVNMIVNRMCLREEVLSVVNCEEDA